MELPFSASSAVNTPMARQMAAGGEGAFRDKLRGQARVVVHQHPEATSGV